MKVVEGVVYGDPSTARAVIFQPSQTFHLPRMIEKVCGEHAFFELSEIISKRIDINDSRSDIQRERFAQLPKRFVDPSVARDHDFNLWMRAQGLLEDRHRAIEKPRLTPQRVQHAIYVEEEGQAAHEWKMLVERGNPFALMQISHPSRIFRVRVGVQLNQLCRQVTQFNHRSLIEDRLPNRLLHQLVDLPGRQVR